MLVFLPLVLSLRLTQTKEIINAKELMKEYIRCNALTTFPFYFLLDIVLLDVT